MKKKLLFLISIFLIKNSYCADLKRMKEEQQREREELQKEIDRVIQEEKEGKLSKPFTVLGEVLQDQYYSELGHKYIKTELRPYFPVDQSQVTIGQKGIFTLQIFEGKFSDSCGVHVKIIKFEEQSEPDELDKAIQNAKETHMTLDEKEFVVEGEIILETRNYTHQYFISTKNGVTFNPISGLGHPRDKRGLKGKFTLKKFHIDGKLVDNNCLPVHVIEFEESEEIDSWCSIL